MLWNATDRSELGNAARRHVGIYQVNVRGPQVEEPEPQTEIADLLIEHFDKQVISNSSVIVRIGSFNGGRSVPWRGTSIAEDGWRLTVVSIPFWSDVFPS